MGYIVERKDRAGQWKRWEYSQVRTTQVQAAQDIKELILAKYQDNYRVSAAS